MPGCSRPRAPWYHLFALACVSLALIGCGARPAGSAGNAAETKAVKAVDARVARLGARSNLGLSATAMFYALGDTTSSISEQPSPFRFTDVVAAAGIDFIHVSGMDARKHYPTGFGSGVAMFDFDGDGRLDLYFATCNPLPKIAGPQSRNRLYRNRGDGTFADATERSGLGFAGFCHGIIAGDIDNDGDADVFLCNYGSNALFLNSGDGTFRDISHGAGIDARSWSSGGAMLDYDNDGDLDLYVANYGEWVYPRDARHCGSDRVPLFCSPFDIRTVRHFLYRNNGDLTFTEVAERAGLGRSDGHGFGVVAADLNGDGRIDLYVANDMNPNFLFLNQGDGTFDDATEASGVAFDARGQAQSSMGVDAEDCDGDGWPELFVTNFQNEHIAYYQNLTAVAPAGPKGLREPVFREASADVGLAADSRPWVGWGCALADLDNDGWPDAFVANGHLDDNRRDLAPTMSYPEPPLLYRNVAGTATSESSGGSRYFRLSTRDVGPYFATRHVARGAAFGDLDDDGDIDIVVNQMDGAPALLRNDTPSTHAWVRLALVGSRTNRDAIGARVIIEAGGRRIVRQRKGGCSLQSTNDPRMLIGLGQADEITRVTVRWPSGATLVREHLAPDQTYELVEPAENDTDKFSGELARKIPVRISRRVDK
jgi:hypothetical protein